MSPRAIRVVFGVFPFLEKDMICLLHDNLGCSSEEKRVICGKKNIMKCNIRVRLIVIHPCWFLNLNNCTRVM